jgi:hypothetical protein
MGRRLEPVDFVKESAVLIDLIHKLDRGQPILEPPPERPAGAPPSGRILRPFCPHC